MSYNSYILESSDNENTYIFYLHIDEEKLNYEIYKYDEPELCKDLEHTFYKLIKIDRYDVQKILQIIINLLVDEHINLLEFNANTTKEPVYITEFFHMCGRLLTVKFTDNSIVKTDVYTCKTNNYTNLLFQILNSKLSTLIDMYRFNLVNDVMSIKKYTKESTYLDIITDDIVFISNDNTISLSHDNFISQIIKCNSIMYNYCHQIYKKNDFNYIFSTYDKKIIKDELTNIMLHYDEIDNSIITLISMFENVIQ